jgi:hypothetical protein
MSSVAVWEIRNEGRGWSLYTNGERSRVLTEIDHGSGLGLDLSAAPATAEEAMVIVTLQPFPVVRVIRYLPKAGLRSSEQGRPYHPPAITKLADRIRANQQCTRTEALVAAGVLYRRPLEKEKL